jgi:hypothetical protein
MWQADSEMLAKVLYQPLDRQNIQEINPGNKAQCVIMVLKLNVIKIKGNSHISRGCAQQIHVFYDYLLRLRKISLSINRKPKSTWLSEYSATWRQKALYHTHWPRRAHSHTHKHGQYFLIKHILTQARAQPHTHKQTQTPTTFSVRQYSNYSMAYTKKRMLPREHEKRFYTSTVWIWMWISWFTV